MPVFRLPRMPSIAMHGRPPPLSLHAAWHSTTCCRLLTEPRPAALSSGAARFFGLQLLMEQPYIRDPNMKVDELVKSYIAKLGENIKVARFVRFNLGDTNTDADEEE